jgi:hypothetical protein
VSPLTPEPAPDPGRRARGAGRPRRCSGGQPRAISSRPAFTPSIPARSWAPVRASCNG